ncbi:MAG: Hcp family type VI secretion system effector [candidate division Zixibacteria bacterium]|nr:Hcp family type VI secretion system effector [candidate division Zixibacteria bacterium]
MPMPFYQTLEGYDQGKIEGSCDQSGREGTILCQALVHDVSIPRDPQTGQPSGQRVHSALTITKVFDKASPKLYQALTRGERMKTVEMKWYRIDNTGTEQHYFTIKLEDAIIVSMHPSIPNCLDPRFASYGHMEDVGFTYRKIIWTWEPDGIESEDDWKVRKQ